MAAETGAMARALYIHWPFCRSKCPYCDFNSHVRDWIDAAAWREALLADMRFEAGLPGVAEPLKSVFFGGGTPTLLSAGRLSRLLSGGEVIEELGWRRHPRHA